MDTTKQSTEQPAEVHLRQVGWTTTKYTEFMDLETRAAIMEEPTSPAFNELRISVHAKYSVPVYIIVD